MKKLLTLIIWLIALSYSYGQRGGEMILVSYNQANSGPGGGPPVYEYSHYDIADGLNGVQEANSISSYFTLAANTTESVTTGSETNGSAYGLKSIATGGTSWIDHDIILPNGFPGRTYKIDIDYKRSSLAAPHRAGVYSFSNATQNPAAINFRNTNWQHAEVYLENSTNTIDFNLYTSYGTDDPPVVGEGILWDNLIVREVRPNLYTSANYLRAENESSLSTGITLSGVTRTAHHFQSTDPLEPADYLKTAIRSNSRVQEFNGTGYWETTTTGLTIGEAYEFSLAVSGSGTFSGWTGASVDQSFSTATNQWEIVEIPFVATATSVTHRMNISGGSVYVAGLRVVHDSDYHRTDLYGNYAGSYANHSSTNMLGWSVSGGASAALETSVVYRGDTALRINGSASNSYIFSYPVLASIGVGQTARVSGRYYVVTPGGTQRILIYDSGAVPTHTPVNFDQTNTGRWVRFEIEFTRQANAMGLEIGAGSGVVIVDDLIITNKSETIDLSPPPASDPILALSPDAYYTPASIDPAVTTDNSAISVWNDVSGNGFHATSVNAKVLNLGSTGRQVEWGTAGYFDIPDNAALNFNPQTDDATIVWRLGDAAIVNAAGYPISKASSTTSQRVFGAVYNGAGVYSNVYAGGTAIAISPNTGAANHLAVAVISGGFINMWIDGVQVVNNQAVGTTWVDNTSWNIGGRSDGGYMAAAGNMLDLVAICIGTAATAQQRADIFAYWGVN